MNGRQWLHTIGELGSSVWETANLPEAYWNKDKDYATSSVHVPPIFAGVSNGLTEEALGLQQLIKLGYDVVTKEEVRQSVWEGLTNITFSSLLDAGGEAIQNKVDQYANYQDKPYIAQQAFGKDAVQVVTTAVGIGVITKSGKLAEGVTDVGKQIGKKSREKLEEFIQKSLKDRLEIINNHWKVKYPDVFTRGRFFEDLMGVYRYKKADGWAHTVDIADNFKGVDFYKDYFELNNIISTKTAVSMKTTVIQDVNVWLNSEPIKKNINFLRDAFKQEGLSSNGKFFKITEKAEVHIYMPKNNITPELKATWMNKLNDVDSKIKFEIRALEDYLN